MGYVVNKGEIKDACDMVDVARTLGIELQRKGSIWCIRCPCHYNGTKIDEHIGNCYIKHNNSFVCKSCSNHGDVFTLVRQVLNCTFPEALNWLSSYTGIELQYAEEGDEYIDSCGERRIVRKILTYDDIQFLEINNSSVYKEKSLFDKDMYLYAYNKYAKAEIDEKGEVKYYREQEMVETNPLMRLAQDNYDIYRLFIKNSIKRKYDKLIKEYNDAFETADELEYETAMTKGIYRLKDIFESIGGDPAQIKFPLKRIKFEVDLTTVPF